MSMSPHRRSRMILGLWFAIPVWLMVAGFPLFTEYPSEHYPRMIFIALAPALFLWAVIAFTNSHTND